MIEYSIDHGQNWQQVCQCKNTGFYLWNPVPVVDSDQCLVRISDLEEDSIYDTCNSTFTIFQCLKQLPGDLNNDCYVDFLDLAVLAGDWLNCGNPFDPSCE